MKRFFSRLFLTLTNHSCENGKWSDVKKCYALDLYLAPLFIAISCGWSLTFTLHAISFLVLQISLLYLLFETVPINYLTIPLSLTRSLFWRNALYFLPSLNLLPHSDLWRKQFVSASYTSYSGSLVTETSVNLAFAVREDTCKEYFYSCFLFQQILPLWDCNAV